MTTKAYKIRIILRFISPLLIGTVLFMSLRPVLVLAATEQEDQVDYSGLRTGYNIDPDGYRQIKYELDGNNKKITNDGTPHVDPDSDDEMIVWAALVGSRWQIFLYDAKTEETTQITTTGNNIHPAISGDIIVWEGFVNGVWQIFMFDGIKITQITSGNNSSQDVGVDGDYIVYSQMTDDKEGRRIYYYQISTGAGALLTPYSFGSNPTISNGIVSWEFLFDGQAVQLSYNVNDVLNAPQVAGIQTSGTDIQAELVNEAQSLETSGSTSATGLIIDSVQVSDEIVEEVETNLVEAETSEEVLTEPETVSTQDIQEELGIIIDNDASLSKESTEEAQTEENPEATLVEEVTTEEESTTEKAIITEEPSETIDSLN